MKLTKAYFNYIDNQNKKNLAQSTLEDCKQRLKLFLSWYGEKELESLKPNDLELLKSHLISKYARSCVNQYVIRINAFLNYLDKDELLSFEKVRRLKLKKIQVVQKDKLLPALDHILRTINNFPQDKEDSCLTVLMTGISWAELCNLDGDSFDKDNLYIKESKNIHRTREIPMNKKLYEILSRNKKTSNRAKLFPSAPNFRKWLLRNLTSKDAKFTPNLLKHIFASNIKVEQPTLRKMLGHAKGSKTTDKFYVHTDNQTYKEGYSLWRKKIHQQKQYH
jgi:site-specific recombinase XerD